MNQPVDFLDDDVKRSGKAQVVSIDGTLCHGFASNQNDQSSRRLLDALPAAVCTTDAAGHLTYYNDAAADLWGHRPALGSTEWCGSLKLYWADGTPMAHADCPMARALKEHRPMAGLEATAERPDGTRVPFLAYPTPIYDGVGRLTGAINMLVDITERKRAEQQQSMLIRELHHRVKNTLATVQAIMSTTARSANTIEAFKTALIGRIRSLAKTHLLLADETRAVGFDDLLHKELGAFDDGADGRIIMSGTPVELTTELAVPLGMALHELTVNSAKFGALSVPEGRVTAIWRVTSQRDGHTLDFDWVESGGPAVAPPAHEGFGTRLLEVVLPNQIRASTQIDYATQGVHVHYAVPLPAQR